jgi:hypothetical protein
MMAGVLAGTFVVVGFFVCLTGGCL